MQQLYSELKDKGLELIAVNGDDAKEVINKYIEENQFSFVIGMGGENGGQNPTVATRFRVSAFPTNYIVDSHGKIVFSSQGFDEAGMRAALGKLGVK